MNLIIDIGNSRTKYYVFKHSEVPVSETEEGGSLSGLHTFVEQATQKLRLPINHAIISSTIGISPEAQRQLEALPCPTLYFTHETITPLENQYATPQTLGPDRLAAAVGAWCQNKGRPLLIIDIGTCITIDFVTKTGIYKGGNISPGLRMRLQAMHEHTAHLPLVELEGPTPEWGRDTDTAIRTGVTNGVWQELIGYVNDIYRYRSMRVYITGGDARTVFPLGWGDRVIMDPILVARGLNYILKYNLRLGRIK